jgi:hypothetical protein
VDVVAVAGERDYFAPLASTVLEGVRHVALPTCHSGLLVDAAVADTLVEILRAPSDGPSSRGEKGSGRTPPDESRQ